MWLVASSVGVENTKVVYTRTFMVWYVFTCISISSHVGRTVHSIQTVLLKILLILMHVKRTIT